MECAQCHSREILLLVSRTAGNPNREFFKCKKCSKWLGWADDSRVAPSVGSAQAASSSSASAATLSSGGISVLNASFIPNLVGMTVAQLKGVCKQLDLTVGGNKPELVAKIIAKLDSGDGVVSVLPGTQVIALPALSKKSGGDSSSASAIVVSTTTAKKTATKDVKKKKSPVKNASQKSEPKKNQEGAKGAKAKVAKVLKPVPPPATAVKRPSTSTAAADAAGPVVKRQVVVPPSRPAPHPPVGETAAARASSAKHERLGMVFQVWSRSAYPPDRWHGYDGPGEMEHDSYHATLEAANARARVLFVKGNPWGVSPEDMEDMGRPETEFVHGMIRLGICPDDSEKWEVGVECIPQPLTTPAAKPCFFQVWSRCAYPPDRWHGYEGPGEKEHDSYHTSLDAANSKARELFIKGNPWGISKREFEEMSIEKSTFHGMVRFSVCPEDSEKWEVGVDCVPEPRAAVSVDRKHGATAHSGGIIF